MGVGKLIALPLSTPPETGFIKGRGAGGESLFVTTTFLDVSSDGLRNSPDGGVTPDSLSLSKEVAGGKAETGFESAGFDGRPTTSPVAAFAGAGELPGWSIFAMAASR